MNLTALKLCIIRTLSAVSILRCRFKGVQFGKGCLLGGMPQIHKKRGTRIMVGNGVTLHSNPRYNTLINRPVSLNTIKPGACIELGDGCGMSGVKITCATRVTVGELTTIGANTVIYDCKQHQYDPEIGWMGIKELTGAPITIGKRCFIGMNCIILKGVTIGDNAVISAGTIISKDVPAGHLASGNPAVYTPLPERLRLLPDGSIVPLGTN